MMDKIREFEYELTEKHLEKICSDVDRQLAKEMFLTFPLAMSDFNEVFTGGAL
jgi:hypothetical protein